MPDYQGIGIGVLILNEVSKLLSELKNRVIITTTNPALMFSLNKNKRWKLKRRGRVGAGSGIIQNKQVKGSTSSNRITTSWEYVPKNEISSVN